MHTSPRLRTIVAASLISVLGISGTALAAQNGALFGGLGVGDQPQPQQQLQQRQPGNTGPYDNPDFVVPESQIFS